MQLSIVIPVFNEKDNIGLLVRDIYEKLNKTEFELTIVDDSSNDGTIEVLKNIERKYKDIKIIYRKDQPRDLSKSCQEGFENSKYENILVMDGDLQHDPIYIPEMINEFEKYNCDIVIGARDLLTKKIEGLGYLRQEISKILIKIINIFLKRKTMDPMSGYFLFKKQVYTKNKNLLYLKGYKILADLIYSNKEYLNIRDIKIEFRHRIGGSSKANIRVFFLLGFFMLKKIIKNLL